MRKTTRKNLKTCFPDIPAEDLDKLAIHSLQNTMKTALEMGKSWFWPMEKTLGLIAGIEGKEILDQAINRGEGVIMLVPHLGNWELFGLFCGQHTPTIFMYQPPKARVFDEMIKSARSRGGLQLAPTSSKGVGRLLKALRNGQMVGILPDQEPGLESGKFAPFFGVPAHSMTLVAGLLSRTSARVICGFAKRLPHGQGFRLIIKNADPLIYDSDQEKSVEGLNRTVEECVKEAPEQYQWEYKRFKRRPDGSRFYE